MFRSFRSQWEELRLHVIVSIGTIRVLYTVQFSIASNKARTGIVWHYPKTNNSTDDMATTKNQSKISVRCHPYTTTPHHSWRSEPYQTRSNAWERTVVVHTRTHCEKIKTKQRLLTSGHVLSRSDATVERFSFHVGSFHSFCWWPSKLDMWPQILVLYCGRDTIQWAIDQYWKNNRYLSWSLDYANHKWVPCFSSAGQACSTLN